MEYCQRCVYPRITAHPSAVDDDGICMGCRMAEHADTIDFTERFGWLRDIVDEYRGQGPYDILIPVGGGKDSYFQAHIATKVLGLRALLVTYHGNNYLPEGEVNLARMRDSFDADHIIFRPPTNVLIKMNRLGFRVQGDMNWHAHCGIFTYPVQVAVRYKIPLMLWGEHGFADLGGMYSPDDLVEYTAKYRLEHALRGYDWHDFTSEGIKSLGMEEYDEGLTEADLAWARYPDDASIRDVGVRGLYLANFLRWDGNRNAQISMEEYGWSGARQPFQRTYRTVSNLDDMHENGAHDYLKFIKFGYGRATDHASKDIRSGRISRDRGIELVRQYDSVRPTRDLKRWFDYTGISERDFDDYANRFRDPRVWTREGDSWGKDTLWGEVQSF